MNNLFYSISLKCIFPTQPTLLFEPKTDTCPTCGKILNVKKTRTKTVATLIIGMFKAHETILSCKKCNNDAIYFSKDLLELVPHRCNFGYDLLVHIGKDIFLRNRNEKEIKSELERKNIDISESEISYLAKKFIIYLSIAHKASRKKLKKYMNKKGGYILHLDATCEGNSPHLMTGLDEISKIILENIKLPSENADAIIPFLSRIKNNYGNPIALVHDMGKGILNAIKKVFPNVKDFICHFHFLRDIGKDLLGKENDIIRKQLKKHSIQGLLRKKIRILKKDINKNPCIVNFFIECLHSKKATPFQKKSNISVLMYTLINWALDGKNQGDGYGFPFDRPYFVFYKRLKELYSALIQIKNKTTSNENKIFIKLLKDLNNIINDSVIQEAIHKMERKVIVFEKLREAMRIALPSGNQGLNDNGDENLQSIENKVKLFYEWLCKEYNIIKEDEYKKMIAQIKKYWDRLFADAIIIDTKEGKIKIYPQRTNNILEQLFREIKRRFRKKSGTKSLSKTLKAMLADTPLIKNLENPEYLKIILNGKVNLEERFADINAELFRKELLNIQNDRNKIPAKIKNIINKATLSDILMPFFQIN